MNIRNPTRETIMFLDGLIGLLLETKDAAIEKYMVEDEVSLLKSFSYYNNRDIALEDLTDIALESIEDEGIIFFNIGDDNIRKKDETENIWRRANITNDDYKHLWLHRWISMHILNKIDPTIRANKEKVVKLIKYSSNLIPGYIKT